jgi:hypothetical protein
VPSSRHAIYIVGLSVFWGELILGGESFNSHGNKGSNQPRKDDHYLICNKNIVRVFLYCNHIFVVEEAGCQARDYSL